MLEKPDLPDEKVAACLAQAYGLRVASLAFLPLGADLNTAVYRAVAGDGTPYFVKLRRGAFHAASVAIPRFLSDQGMRQIIPPLRTGAGALWANLAPFKVILYPFVAGHDGFEVALSDQQRIEFGAALKRLHTARIPAALTHGVRRETFTPHWRQTVTAFLARIDHEAFAEPAAAALAAFLNSQRPETLALLRRSERLAQAVRAQSRPFVLCHADIHGWNLLLGNDGALYMVDWDTLIFAPKERDLMFVGVGLGGRGHAPAAEEALFYQGYGPSQPDPRALAYYRYERIIEDIALYCQQLLLTDEGGADRAQALAYLQSNYGPGGTIAMATRADKTRAGDG